MKDRGTAPASVRTLWCLEGSKAGDNAQLRVLADALVARGGWQSRSVHMRYRPSEVLLHLRSRPTLAGLQTECRAAITPPWPDLVLTAGRRNELPARWIAHAGGAKIVHFGRPWSDPGVFDLILTTLQYELPEGANVLNLSMPLMRGSARPAAAVECHGASPPVAVVLLGGNSGPYVFHRGIAQCLAEALNRHLQPTGGTALLVTSRRTPPGFADRLRHALTVPHRLFTYQGPAADPGRYQRLLTAADELIVTGDSVSMVTDAMLTGKPARIFDLERCPGLGLQRLHKFSWKPLTHGLAMRFAPPRMHRNVHRLLEHWVAAGHAEWLHEATPAFRPEPVDPAPDLARVLASVNALFD